MDLFQADSVNVDALPDGMHCYAGYANGTYANVSKIEARFPGVKVYQIDVLNAGVGDYLDVEKGDAQPADTPGWWHRRRQAAVARPGIYGSPTTWAGAGGIAAELTSAGIVRGAVTCWTAHYDPALGAHLCTPELCGMPDGWTADLTQYTDTGTYDLSLLGPTFGPPTPPDTTGSEEIDMRVLIDPNKTVWLCDGTHRVWIPTVPDEEAWLTALGQKAAAPMSAKMINQFTPAGTVPS